MSNNKSKSTVLGTTVIVDGKECKVIGDFANTKTMLVNTENGIKILSYETTNNE